MSKLIYQINRSRSFERAFSTGADKGKSAAYRCSLIAPSNPPAPPNPHNWLINHGRLQRLQLRAASCVLSRIGDVTRCRIPLGCYLEKSDRNFDSADDLRIPSNDTCSPVTRATVTGEAKHFRKHLATTGLKGNSSGEFS